MDVSITSSSHPDRAKKRLSCLGCGRPMWTDRCHRICRKCRRRNNASPGTHAYHVALPPEALYEPSSTRAGGLDY